MRHIRIKINPDRLDEPIIPATVGKLSSAVFFIEGDFPDDTDTLAIQFGRVGENLANFTVAATRVDGGFRAYASPFNFPTASDALRYHVIATDLNGNPRWLGSGLLRVRENPADGSPVVPEIIPADTYIRNPATGLYHKLTASVNEYGELSIDLEPEGIERWNTNSFQCS